MSKLHQLQAAYLEFARTPAPKIPDTSSDLWFDGVTAGTYVAGVVDAICSGAPLDSIQLQAVERDYLVGTNWIFTLHEGEAPLDERSSLYSYAKMIQQLCSLARLAKS